jgi:hypothetical protein
MDEFFPMSEQVEHPLQLSGARVQVRGELSPGLCPAAAQRVKQLAVVVRRPADFAAGALGQREGEGGGWRCAPPSRRMTGPTVARIAR